MGISADFSVVIYVIIYFGYFHGDSCRCHFTDTQAAQRPGATVYIKTAACQVAGYKLHSLREHVINTNIFSPRRSFIRNCDRPGNFLAELRRVIVGRFLKT